MFNQLYKNSEAWRITLTEIGKNTLLIISIISYLYFLPYGFEYITSNFTRDEVHNTYLLIIGILAFLAAYIFLYLHKEETRKKLNGGYEENEWP